MAMEKILVSRGSFWEINTVNQTTGKIIWTELRAALLCAILSVIQSYFVCTACRDDARSFFFLCLFSFFMWLFLWRGNCLVTYAVNKNISWIQQPVKRLFAGFTATLTYSILIILATISFFETVFNFHLGSSFMPTVVYSVLFTVVCSLFLHGRQFLLNWRKLELDAVTLRNENLSSRYESLKSQLDPHFLFNSLNVLTNLVYQDADKSARFIKQLSVVYRYVLDNRDKELVTLQEEMKCVDAYLYLQQIRFGGKLVIQNQLSDIEGEVPPLVIQMLAENAIKHNTISNDDPLVINFHKCDGCIVVENSLQPKDILNVDSLGIGLENIKKRYEFFSDQPVKISRSNGKFSVTIPILTSSAKTENNHYVREA